MPPRSRIILFGSYARGEVGADSDLDLLVIEPDAVDQIEESVRLRRTLDDLRVPADVMVVSADQVEEWGAVPSTMLHTALTEGRVLAET